MALATVSILLVVLVNVLVVLHEKRLRRLAAARLEVVEAVTEIERLMADGKIKRGTYIHDNLYKKMLVSQYATTYRVRWKFWNLPPEAVENRKRFEREAAANSEVGAIVARFARADLSEFQNRKPYLFIAFLLWILFCAGGLMTLFGGLICLAGMVRTVRRLRENYDHLRELMASWTIVINPIRHA